MPGPARGLVDAYPQAVLRDDHAAQQVRGDGFRDGVAAVADGDAQWPGAEFHGNADVRLELAFSQGVVEQVVQHAVEQRGGDLLVRQSIRRVPCMIRFM